MIYDIALIKKNGFYDIDFNQQGDLSMTDTLDNAILISIFGCKRASDTDIVFGESGGWFGNIYSDNKGYELGSELWRFRQSRNSIKDINHIRTTISQSLSWLVSNQFCTHYNVVVQKEYDKLTISVQLFLNDKTIFSNKYSNL